MSDADPGKYYMKRNVACSDEIIRTNIGKCQHCKTSPQSPEDVSGGMSMFLMFVILVHQTNSCVVRIPVNPSSADPALFFSKIFPGTMYDVKCVHQHVIVYFVT